jgi:hypothetical protein
MSRLRPNKLHVTFAPGTEPGRPITPRFYTLTHSDVTGDLFLTIGAEHDQKQIAGFYTRLMRDEVLAEWHEDDDGPALHAHCHISGGLIFGSAQMRDGIFKRVLPLVLEAFRYGDRRLFETHPALDEAPILIHFQARQQRYNRVEPWGVPADYQPESA